MANHCSLTSPQETIDIILFEIFENEENNFNLSLSMQNEKILTCSLFGNENENVYFTKSQFKELLKLATLDNHFYFKLMVRFITKLMAWQWEVL